MKKLLFFLSISAILFVIPNQVKADVIYNTFGPGDSYDQNNGWTLGATSSSGPWTQGDAFTTPAGSNYKLSSIALAASLAAAGSNQLDVWLMSDNSGKPDFILESFHFDGQMGSFGDNNPPLIANSAVHPVLTAGMQYWLIATTTDPDAWAAWNFNDQGKSGLHVQEAPGHFVDDAWHVDNLTSGAFRIDATIGGTSSVVPEPVSTTLFLLGGATLAVRRLRRK